MQRYIDNKNGTIKDTKTGLIWQKSDDGMKRNLKDSEKYVEELDLAGYYDWRVPTIEELFSIIDFARYDPAINPVFECWGFWYWSNSSDASNRDSAWRVQFYNGYMYWANKNDSGLIRCVRSDNNLPCRKDLKKIRIETTSSDLSFLGKYRRDLETNNWHYYEDEHGTIYHLRKKHIIAVIEVKNDKR